MTRYIKKPVEVNAWQLTKENIATGLPDWFDHKKVHIFNGKEKAMAEIETIEGVLECEEGDFIIQQFEGEFYTCTPDLFYATYDKAPARLRDGREDYSVVEDDVLAAKYFHTQTEHWRIGKEIYKRKIEKQVAEKGVVFGKSVITVEGLNGEYFVPDMEEQLSRINFVPFPMIALRRIKVNGKVSGKIQYTQQTHPVITVVGEYDFGREGGVKYA